MNEFKRFEDRLTELIESLSPSGRRRLSAELAKRLRQSQQRRVIAYFHERRSLNNFHRDRVITFEQIAE